MKNPRAIWHGLGQDLWANGVSALPIVPASARYMLLRGKGFRIGRTKIEPGVHWFGSGPVTVGDGGYINRRTVINHSGPVTIGDNVYFGPECMILSATHEVGGPDQRCGPGYSQPTTIGNGAWLGARVIVMAGVIVGEGAIVGAGAVVTKDVPPHHTYAGVPARKVSSLGDIPA